MATASKAPFKIWELPEVLLFQIVSFAAGPTERVTVICHHLAPLCVASRRALLIDTSPLWTAILKSDYGAKLNERADKRSSKRLKQSYLQRVRDAHILVRENAEHAYINLTELTCSGELTRQKLRALIEKYSIQMRINQLTSTGGAFLVECCRARRVQESTILRCVEELVERYGANVDLAVNETVWSESPPEKPLTALCVASARGMPTIVKYLLEHGADPTIACTARFQLYRQPRKSVKCTNKSALDFAEVILAAEIKEGATSHDVKNLNKVVVLLTKHAADEN